MSQVLGYVRSTKHLGDIDLNECHRQAVNGSGQKNKMFYTLKTMFTESPVLASVFD